MSSSQRSWNTWRRFFAARQERRLPPLDDPQDYSAVPASVARSLAIFQLGESGGGTVIEQARNSRLDSVDSNYAEAMKMFVAEEHRHAAILAICVRTLGGKLIRRNWTARLFVFARRLIGLRLKVLVLLAAEVVGICYYHLLASRLPDSRIRSMLAQIVNDERSHLHFHCDFLRGETRSAWRRLAFVAAWRATMCAAAIVVLVDHRHALRDLGIPVNAVWRRWKSYSRLAERLVLAKAEGFDYGFDAIDRCEPFPAAKKTADLAARRSFLTCMPVQGCQISTEPSRSNGLAMKSNNSWVLPVADQFGLVDRSTGADAAPPPSARPVSPSGAVRPEYDM